MIDQLEQIKNKTEITVGDIMWMINEIERLRTHIDTLKLKNKGLNEMYEMKRNRVLELSDLNKRLEEELEYEKQALINQERASDARIEKLQKRIEELESAIRNIDVVIDNHRLKKLVEADSK